MYEDLCRIKTKLYVLTRQSLFCHKSSNSTNKSDTCQTSRLAVRGGSLNCAGIVQPAHQSLTTIGVISDYHQPVSPRLSLSSCPVFTLWLPAVSPGQNSQQTLIAFLLSTYFRRPGRPALLLSSSHHAVTILLKIKGISLGLDWFRLCTALLRTLLLQPASSVQICAF